MSDLTRPLTNAASIIRIGAVVMLALTSSCSWTTEFGVANYSDSPIVLIYGLREFVPNPEAPNGGCWLVGWSRPAVADLSSISRWGSSRKWQQVDDRELRMDLHECQIELELGSGKIARVHSEINRPDPEPGDCGALCELRIEIRSPEKVHAYSGPELLERFEEEGGIWILAHRP